MKQNDYDLNIFQNDTDDALQDPWFLDIYIVEDGQHRQLQLIKLTIEEARTLNLGEGYFSDYDNWYGLEGFVVDYKGFISDRLQLIFDLLPQFGEV